MASKSEANMINEIDIGKLQDPTLRRRRINKAPNTNAVTSDDACYIDIIGAIIVKGAENCAFLGAGTNKVSKILATFRNYTYLCSVRM